MQSSKKSLATVLLVLTTIVMSSRAVASYDDVAVVVNLNSSTSMAIGEYFKNSRAIPASNMVYVNTSTAEEIDSATFASLRSQIEGYLTVNNLVNSINYLVTTKGLPLKVNRGNLFSSSSPSSSVESELSLILGNYGASIEQPGRITSPYYFQSRSFSRSQYGIYLVTRLDAYTLEQVYSLIDRSGPNVKVPLSAVYIFDQDPDWNPIAPSLNNNMTLARSVLQSKGRTVFLDTTIRYETNRTNVIGYVSWGSNDHYASVYTQNGVPHNAWLPGSIGETYVSTSGRSFDAPPTYGQSLIADLLTEGATGVKGYVYEPYSSAMANAQVLFDRYTSGYNLAESYFMASRYLSWMDVVVGDPKTTIDATNEPQGPLPIQLQYVNASFSPNARSVTISWRTLTETSNYGFFVQWSDSSRAFADVPESFVPGHGTTLSPQSYSWSHTNVPSGTFYYRLRQVDFDGTQHFSDAQRVPTDIVAGVTDATIPERFNLAQNYPNPFNPTTTIAYQLPRPGRVAIRVYSEIGEHVSTLVDAVQPSGNYAITFTGNTSIESRGSDPRSGTGLASAVYFYKMQFEDQIITKKMFMIK